VGATILVVDDDATLRTLLTAVFSSAGLRVLSAASAEDGLALLDGSTVDLVFTDGQLPGISGVELIRRLRSRSDLADVPMFLCTGSSGLTPIPDADAAGATRVLAKPIRPRALLDAVRPYLPESAQVG
jgi:two-component system chemotaxis response regulator CheY